MSPFTAKNVQITRRTIFLISRKIFVLQGFMSALSGLSA
jgi:hypothetical protein